MKKLSFLFLFLALTLTCLVRGGEEKTTPIVGVYEVVGRDGGTVIMYGGAKRGTWRHVQGQTFTNHHMWWLSDAGTVILAKFNNQEVFNREEGMLKNQKASSGIVMLKKTNDDPKSHPIEIFQGKWKNAVTNEVFVIIASPGEVGYWNNVGVYVGTTRWTANFQNLIIFISYDKKVKEPFRYVEVEGEPQLHGPRGEKMIRLSHRPSY